MTTFEGHWVLEPSLLRSFVTKFSAIPCEEQDIDAEAAGAGIGVTRMELLELQFWATLRSTNVGVSCSDADRA